MLRSLLLGAFLMGLPIFASSSRCETMLSAYTMDDTTYFITDKQIYRVTENGITTVLSANRLPEYARDGSALVCLSTEHKFIRFKDGQVEVLDYGGRVQPSVSHFFPNGVHADAATVRDDMMLVFEGSKYQPIDVSFTMKPMPPMGMSEIGLPSDVDAAWFFPKYQLNIVLKGNLVWISSQWDAQRRTYKFTGPLHFSRFFQIPELNLCVK